MNKMFALKALARKRASAKWDGYSNIGDYHSGAYECAHVSPYTKGAANYDSSVFVLLQDWASHSWMAGPLDKQVLRLGRTPELPTNVVLSKMLRTQFRLNLCQTYATNLFPFVKPGGMSSHIPASALRRAAVEYAWPQIRIVRPKLVICLGLDTFNALRRSIGRRPIHPIASAISKPFKKRGVLVWCQAHTGILGQNNRRRGNRCRVHFDWRRMRRALRRRA